jgi:hypothetical protein
MDGTKKDVDLYVKRAADDPEYIEVKGWTPRLGSSRGNNMRNILFGDRDGNAKFAEADNIDGDAILEVVVSEGYDRDELRGIIERQIRKYREEDGGEVHIDKIRIRDKAGTTQTGQITKGDIAWGSVVGAAATSDGEDSDEPEQVDIPNRPDVSAPLSVAMSTA